MTDHTTCREYNACPLPDLRITICAKSPWLYPVMTSIESSPSPGYIIKTACCDEMRYRQPAENDGSGETLERVSVVRASVSCNASTDVAGFSINL